jgi:hypothetical protein
MAPQRYYPLSAGAKGKTLAELTTTEILELAGPYGPGMIGKELFDRAEEVRTTTSDGKYGPALLDPDYGLKVEVWDDYARKELLVICREHELPVKSNATREELAKALARAKVFPEPAVSGNGEGAE